MFEATLEPPFRHGQPQLVEAHGHEVTREAAVDRMETWAHVSQGALYSALRTCERDGLVSPERTEQVGRFPERTVYALTDDGRTALVQARTAALARTGLPADPFDLALSVSDGRDPAILQAVIEQRVQDYTQALTGLQHEFQGLVHRVEPTAIAVFQHVMLRHQTEITWHKQLLGQVEAFSTSRPATEPKP